MRKGLHGTQGGSHLRPSLDLCLVVGPGADLRRLKAMPPTRASFALSRPISSQPGGRTQLDCVAGWLRIGWPSSATTETSPCRGRAGGGSGFGSAARRSPWWCARGQASKFGLADRVSHCCQQSRAPAIRSGAQDHSVRNKPVRDAGLRMCEGKRTSTPVVSE